MSLVNSASKGNPRTSRRLLTAASTSSAFKAARSRCLLRLSSAESATVFAVACSAPSLFSVVLRVARVSSIASSFNNVWTSRDRFAASVRMNLMISAP